VRRAETIRDAPRDPRRAVCGQLRLALEHGLQIGAVDQLHRQTVLTVRLAEIVRAGDVRVRDAPREPHFSAEALDRRLVRRDAEAERLQRDDVADHRVEGAIDRAHPAASEQLLDAIAPGEEPAQPAVRRWHLLPRSVVAASSRRLGDVYRGGVS